jgi:flagellar motor switch protein FliN/FliY
VATTAREMGFLLDIPIELVIELGRTTLSVKDLSELKMDDVVQLDRAAGQPLDIRAGGRLVGRGEVVVTDDRVSLRVVELLDRAEP